MADDQHYCLGSLVCGGQTRFRGHHPNAIHVVSVSDCGYFLGAYFMEFCYTAGMAENSILPAKYLETGAIWHGGGAELFDLGLNFSTALETSLLTTTQPIFMTIGGIWLLQEKEERHEWIGTLIAFAGTLLLVLGPSLFGQAATFSVFGNLLVLGSIVVNMFYFPLAKKAYRKLPKLLVATLSFYLGLVAFGLLSVFEAGSIQHLWQAISLDMQSNQVWLAALYMGIVGSIVGLTAYIKGQDGIEASEASLFYYLQPLVAIPLAFLVLGDAISPLQILALAIIFVGVYLAEKRRS